MNAPFDPTRFPPPWYLVVSSKEKHQPDMVSLLSDTISVPIVRGRGMVFTPLFTSNHQANIFFQSVDLPDGVVLTLKDAEEIETMLHEAKALGRTRIAFDPPEGTGPFEDYSIDEVIDA